MHYSCDYTEAALKPWASLLLDHLARDDTNEAIYRKYSSKKLIRVAPVMRAYIAKAMPDSAVAKKWAASSGSDQAD